jgi:hypothetical protein
MKMRQQNKKNIFYEELQKIIEAITHEYIIMEDLNARVGKEPVSAAGAIGKEGEVQITNNGERLINLCITHDSFIVNTKFKHEDIHKISRILPERKEELIIDYIIMKKTSLQALQDAKVRRGPEIGSDHYMLTVIKVSEEERSRSAKKIYYKQRDNQRDEERRIQVYKLKDEQKRLGYRTRVGELIQGNRVLEFPQDNLEML